MWRDHIADADVQPENGITVEPGDRVMPITGDHRGERHAAVGADEEVRIVGSVDGFDAGKRASDEAPNRFGIHGDPLLAARR